MSQAQQTAQKARDDALRDAAEARRKRDEATSKKEREYWAKKNQEYSGLARRLERDVKKKSVAFYTPKGTISHVAPGSEKYVKAVREGWYELGRKQIRSIREKRREWEKAHPQMIIPEQTARQEGRTLYTVKPGEEPRTYIQTFYEYEETEGETEPKYYIDEREPRGQLITPGFMDVGPPQIASQEMIESLRAQGYDLPEDKTIYISPSGQPYYYEGEIEIEEPDKALSAQLWEESEVIDEAKTGKLFGIIPYSEKGIRQIGAIYTGSLERGLTPILRLIPGKQPLEIAPGEKSISWRDVEGLDQLSEADKRVAQLSGFAVELVVDIGVYEALGYVHGKTAKVVGGAVSRVPVLGSKATKAAEYLLKPRLATTVGVATGLAAAETVKLAEIYREGASLGRIGGELGLDVAAMVAYDVGFSKGLGSVSFLESARETMPVKHGKTSIPLQEGGVAEWEGLYLSKGDDAVILTGEITVRNAEGGVIARSYVPESNIDSQATIKAMKKLGYDPTDIQNIEDIRAIVSRTQGVTSQYIDDVLPVETGTLSEKGVETVKKFVLEHIDDVEQVYGSYAVRPQLDTSVEYVLRSGDRTISALRTPGDIDIQLTRSPEEATKFADDLLDDLLSSGEKVRIAPESPLLIESSVGEGKWAHAVDIHATGDMIDTIPASKTWGFSLDKPSVKIEDLPAMSAAEQGIRKGSSIMGFTAEGGIGPKEHRLKDIPDFFQVQDTLIKSMRPPSVKTRTQLDTLLERYGGVEEMKKIYASDIDDILEVGYTWRPQKVDPSRYSVASPVAYSVVSPAIKLPSFIEPVSTSKILEKQSVKLVSAPSMKTSRALELPSLKVSLGKLAISSKVFPIPSPPSTGDRQKISFPSPSMPTTKSYKVTIPSPSRPTFPSPSPPPIPTPTEPSIPTPSPSYPTFPSEPDETIFPPIQPQPIKSKKKKKKVKGKRRKGVFELRVDFKEPKKLFKEPEIKA